MAHMKKILLNIIYTGIIVAIGCLVILLILSKYKIQGVPQVFVVQSGSMEPVLHVGSIVIVERNAAYRTGDIITFNRAGNATPVTHRIVTVNGTNGLATFTVKGDANNAPDVSSVSLAQVIGTVRFTIPFLGYAIAAAKQPVGFLLIIIVPALIIVFDEIKKIVVEVKRIRSQRTSSKP
jgi:signal peptidase I